MLVNNINISSLDMKLLTVDIQSSEITNNCTWNVKAINPTFVINNTGFKNIRLEILCKGISRQVILNNISNLVSEFIKNKSSTVNLDKYDSNFICSLMKSLTNKTKSKFRYILELELIGYEENKTEASTIISDSNEHIIICYGTTVTPCYLEILPEYSCSEITLTGLSEDPIKIKNLTANVPIIIGYNNKITQNGINKFNDVELYEFPRLVPGNNIVKLSNDNVTLTIKYKERYI